MRSLQRFAPFALLVVFFGVWKAYVELFDISPFILPSPEIVAVEVGRFLADASILRHVRVTLFETLTGFVIATIVGVGLGALIGKTRWLERLFRPYIVATQVIPKVALAPLFVLWFGFGPQSKIVLAVLLAFFPIITNTILGVKSINEGHSDVMRGLNASRWQSFRKVEFPSSLPYILTGMEVGIVLAQIGAIVGEYLGGSAGLGYLAVVTLNQLQVGRLFGVITVLTLMGFLLHSAVTLLRRVAIPWHESARHDMRAETTAA